MALPLAAIVRVSHMGARRAGANDVHADRDQVAACEGYARRLRVPLVFMPPELSVSGGKAIDDRPSLRAAIEGVEAGLYGGIVVSYLSRLTRSRSGIEIWERVEAAGGHVHCAYENLDTSTPNGRFIRDIHLANAVREREEHAAAHAHRRRVATAAGIWQRRQTPTGYRKDPGSRQLVPDDRADDVREAFRARAAGVPLVRIADRLRMSPSGVRQLLRNRVYLGELRVGQEFNASAHPALITVDEYEAAQVTIARPGRQLDKQPALLAGLIRCAACGHVMSRGTTSVAITYSCHGRSSAGRCPAPAAVTTHILDAAVGSIAVRELERLSVSGVERSEGIDEAREALAAAERELVAYIGAVSVEDVGPEAFGKGARARREAVDEARAELHRASALRPGIPGFEDGAGVWDVLDQQQRNHVLRGLLEAVIVRPAGRGRRVPLEDRVRVLAHGAGLIPDAPPGGTAAGVRPLPFPDLDDPRCLRMGVAEDSSERPGG